MDIESRPLLGKSDSKCFVIFLTCMAAMGGLLFGYDTGIVSGSMLLIKDDFKLSSVWQEAIVSATIGAAAVFALISGTLVDVLGRKTVIMASSFIFTAGAVVMALSPVDLKEVLLVGRLIAGAAIGKDIKSQVLLRPSVYPHIMSLIHMKTKQNMFFKTFKFTKVIE